MGPQPGLQLPRQRAPSAVWACTHGLLHTCVRVECTVPCVCVWPRACVCVCRASHLCLGLRGPRAGSGRAGGRATRQAQVRRWAPTPLFLRPHTDSHSKKHNTNTEYSVPPGAEHTRELSRDAVVKNPVSRGPEAWGMRSSLAASSLAAEAPSARGGDPALLPAGLPPGVPASPDPPRPASLSFLAAPGDSPPGLSAPLTAFDGSPYPGMRSRLCPRPPAPCIHSSGPTDTHVSSLSPPHSSHASRDSWADFRAPGPRGVCSACPLLCPSLARRERDSQSSSHSWPRSATNKPRGLIF